MNYLAHFVLAQPTAPSRLGNLMGDFLRGVDISTLPQSVQNGIANHKAVDKFTDHHSIPASLRAQFSPSYRRFSGIILDVSFDKMLIKHWSNFVPKPRDEFIHDCYEDLSFQFDLMPPKMLSAVSTMLEQDWLSDYQSLEGLERTFHGLSKRIRYQNPMDKAIDEVIRLEEEIEQGFLLFFPILQSHIRQLNLE